MVQVRSLDVSFQYAFLYGRENLDEICSLEKLRIKIKKRDADLKFPSQPSGFYPSP
jgi:hypothetical protein